MTYNRAVFASGYGLRIVVERGHLLVEDAAGSSRRTRRFSRIEKDLNRLVVFGHSGTISFDALRWLKDIGAAFMHLDNDGSLIAVGIPTELRDPRIRRGQAYAAQTATGRVVVREILAAKFKGQRRVAKKLGAADDLIEWIDAAEEALPTLSDYTELRLVEARAAAAYWQAWAGTEVHFPRPDRRRVPAHWLRFDARTSVLTDSQRKAANPVNAILNYLYAILEAESRIALRVSGLILALDSFTWTTGVVRASRAISWRSRAQPWMPTCWTFFGITPFRDRTSSRRGTGHVA